MNNTIPTDSAENVYQIPDDDLITEIFRMIFGLCFVLLPQVGYLHQLIKIQRLKSSEGFSKLISLILIVAFIIRVFYWIGKRFELAILLNSVFGIIMQLILLHACVKYSHYENKQDSKFFSYQEFWNWPYYLDYFHFILLFTVTLNIASLMIGYQNIIYVETLGTFTAIAEATLGVPQMISNFRTRNVSTISYLLVASWFSGDIIKTCYFTFINAPLQLILCSVTQSVVDVVIILQIYFFSKGIEYHQVQQIKP